MRANQWRRKVHRHANHEGERIWAKSDTTLSLGALIVSIKNEEGSVFRQLDRAGHAKVGRRYWHKAEGFGSATTATAIQVYDTHAEWVRGMSALDPK
jgi:hypothetical protein